MASYDGFCNSRKKAAAQRNVAASTGAAKLGGDVLPTAAIAGAGAASAYHASRYHLANEASATRFCSSLWRRGSDGRHQFA